MSGTDLNKIFNKTVEDQAGKGGDVSWGRGSHALGGQDMQFVGSGRVGRTRPAPWTMPLAASAGLVAVFIPTSALAVCVSDGGALPTVTCNAGSNPNNAGIDHSTGTGLSLTIQTGVNVDRTAGGNNDGVRLTGTGNDPLSVVLEDGATISTNGSLADGVEVLATGNSGVDITSAAAITVTIVGNDNPGIGTNGLLGWIGNAGSNASISISQLQGSTITVTGFEGSGIYGLQQGTGSVTLESAGQISTEGEAAYGINGWITNTAATGDVLTTLTETGQIVTNGEYSAGLYSLNYGVGDARATVSGSIETQQLSSEGAISYSNNGSGNGTVSVVFTDTANIVTHGDYSRGGRALSDGLGATIVQSAGTVETFGDNSQGLAASSYNIANTATHTAEVTGTATVRTHGNMADGVSVQHSGGGVVDVSLRDTVVVTTMGNEAHGVTAMATNAGTVGVAAASDTVVDVSGVQSYGLRALAANDATVTSLGTVSASGEFGVGIQALSMAAEARTVVGAGAVVNGGWEASVTEIGPDTGLPSAGVMLSSSAGSFLENQGLIGAGSDRAIGDAARWVVPQGNMTIDNTGVVTGYLELASGGTNSFTNAGGGLFDVRHFADINGDGGRDIKRVSISDFGAATSSFNNLAGATVRLAPVLGEAAIDAAGYYVPTTGIDSRPLEASYYTLGRSGVVQGQFTNLGTFHNAGVIDLRGSAIGNTLVMTGNAAAGGVAGNGVFVSDGGQLLLNTVLNEGVAAGGQTGSFSDVLVVDSTMMGTGATTITIDRREGAGAGTPGNGILLVEVRDKDASAPGVFALNGDFVVDDEQAVVQGAYAYNLFHNGVAGDAGDGNWYLRNLGLSPNVPVYEEYPKVLLPLIDVPTLQQRVGNRYWNEPAPRAARTVFCKDAAQNYQCAVTDEQASYYVGSDGTVIIENNGMWGRIEGEHGHYEPSLSTGSAQYDTNSWKLQAGIDGLLFEGESGKLIGGITVNYGHVSADITATGASGDIETDGYGFGGTLTWYGTNGFYADAQAQATWLDSDLNSSTLGRKLVDGNKGFGYALSLEAGQRIALAHHWTLTPQAQLVYSNVRFDSFTDPFGSTVSLSDGDSLRGRLGLAAEYQERWTQENGTVSRISGYGIVNLYNEFLDGTRVNVSGTEFASRDDRLWGGLGLGGSYNWNDDKYSLYGEVSANTGLSHFGDSFEVGGTLGLRVKW